MYNNNSNYSSINENLLFQRLIKYYKDYCYEITKLLNHFKKLNNSNNHSLDFLKSLLDLKTKNDFENYLMKSNNKSWFGFKSIYEEFEFYDSLFMFEYEATFKEDNKCKNMIIFLLHK